MNQEVMGICFPLAAHDNRGRVRFEGPCPSLEQIRTSATKTVAHSCRAEAHRSCRIFTAARPLLALAVVSGLAMTGLEAQQLSDGTVYAGQSGAPGYSGDGGKATAAELFSPVGVVFDSKGNLYIADALNNRIRRVAAGSGIITTFAGTGQIGSITPGDKDDGAPATKADIIQPTNVAVDGADNVYIFSFANAPRIQKVTASTGIVESIPDAALVESVSVSGVPSLSVCVK
jgi:hypothetical protein